MVADEVAGPGERHVAFGVAFFGQQAAEDLFVDREVAADLGVGGHAPTATATGRNLRVPTRARLGVRFGVWYRAPCNTVLWKQARSPLATAAHRDERKLTEAPP